MKQFIITITLLLIFHPFCHSENDDVPKSYFVKPIVAVCDYPFNDTTKWAVTCRVWGLLKYFHPNVTAGKLDWDKVLIDRLVKINEAETSEKVNAELMQMIRIAGKFEYLKDHTWNDSLNMNVNLCWLDHSFVNDTIRQALREIACLATLRPSYYLKMGERSKAPIPNEKDYDKDVIGLYEYRLLSLFRYWNVIYYFFPYKYLMDQSWDVTLSVFIPQFLTAFDVSSYHKAVQQLVTRLNDGHGYSTISPIYDPFKFQCITLIDSSTVIRNPPKGSLLERGDIILSIDEKNIKSLRDSISPLIPSSNSRFTDNAVNGYIYISIMNGCVLTVMRNQQEITLCEHPKQRPTESPLPRYPISPDNYYINLDKLHAIDIPNMIDSLKNYRGVVFDLRNYPIKFTHWELLRHLIKTQEYSYALATYVDWAHLGAFYESECITKCSDELWQECSKYTGKIAVLINEATMSAAETLAMDFRTLGITLVGTPTAGANGNVTRFSLPGDINVCYSGLGFYFPNGEQTQRKGVIPDIEVYPTMDDIMAGRDEVFEAAITYLNSN